MMRRAFSGVTMPVAAAAMRFYSTRLFSDTHEWVEVTDGVATIGITNFAQEHLGDVVYVALPQVGDKVDKQGNLGEVESIKTTSPIISPVSGEVSDVNGTVKDDPAIINSSAEEKGWLVKVKCSEVAEGLMNAEQYKKFVEDA